MIILENKLLEEEIRIPKNFRTTWKEGYTLRLRNIMNNSTYDYEDLTDTTDYLDYFTFEIDFSAQPDGEYYLTLINTNEKVVWYGLLRIGDIYEGSITREEPKEYAVDIEYKQYNPD